MLHNMSFQLFLKKVALHLDNSKAKAFLCNQGGTPSVFLSRLTCHILNLTDKCGIILISVYIPTHLNVKADCLSWGRLVPEWNLSLCSSGQHFNLRINRSRIFGILMYQGMSELLHLGKSTTSRRLGVECFQQSWDISGELCLTLCISFPSSFQVSWRTYHRQSRLHMLVAPC